MTSWSNESISAIVCLACATKLWWSNDEF